MKKNNMKLVIVLTLATLLLTGCGNSAELEMQSVPEAIESTEPSQTESEEESSEAIIDEESTIEASEVDEKVEEISETVTEVIEEETKEVKEVSEETTEIEEISKEPVKEESKETESTSTETSENKNQGVSDERKAELKAISEMFLAEIDASLNEIGISTSTVEPVKPAETTPTTTPVESEQSAASTPVEPAKPAETTPTTTPAESEQPAASTPVETPTVEPAKPVETTPEPTPTPAPAPEVHTCVYAWETSGDTRTMKCSCGASGITEYCYNGLWGYYDNSAADELWGKVNNSRTNHTEYTVRDEYGNLLGLEAVPALSRTLDSTAQQRALAVALNFSHDGCTTANECIAQGQGDATSAHSNWQTSRTHLDAMTNPTYVNGGVACFWYDSNNSGENLTPVWVLSLNE